MEGLLTMEHGGRIIWVPITKESFMSPSARTACSQAIDNINAGQFDMAIACLRDALRGTHNRRAWSKIMLAIRELSRVVPASG